MKKILVLTSGGDSPGMNAAIRAIVRTACHSGIKVFGSHSGYQGLVDHDLIEMNPDSVANSIQHGGTILHSGRCFDFYEKNVRARCRDFLSAQGIEGVITIGGNGTLRAASLFAEEGFPPVIGIPATIDNDVIGTEYTIGYDTARNTALTAIDKIRDTASSHNRHFLVEVMGRSSGFLAVDVGIAGGAEIILIPEISISIVKLAAKIMQRKRPKLSSIIVVAEADQPGRSVQIAEELRELTQLQYRVCILGHTQRGGSPSTMDRSIASQMGYLAVNGLARGVSGKMTAVNHGVVELANFPPIDILCRTFQQHELIAMNDILCS